MAVEGDIKRGALQKVLLIVAGHVHKGKVIKAGATILC